MPTEKNKMQLEPPGSKAEEDFISGAKGGASAKGAKKTDLDHKITVYLSDQGIEDLENMWFKLRQMTDPAEKKRVNKSFIINQGLALLLEDLEAKGVKSKIAKAVRAALLK